MALFHVSERPKPPLLQFLQKTTAQTTKYLSRAASSTQLLQGDWGRLGQLPPGEMLATEPLQQPWTLLHGAPAQAAAWGLPCPCCTVKPWEESGVHCPPLQNQTQQSPGKPQKDYPVAKISRSAYLLLPGKGVGALRAQGSPSYHLHYQKQRDKQPL